MATRRNGLTREDLAAMMNINKELFNEKLGRIDDGVIRIEEKITENARLSTTAFSVTNERIDAVEAKADSALKFKWKTAGGLGVGGAVLGFFSHLADKLFK